jgi:hypothetical protein
MNNPELFGDGNLMVANEVERSEGSIPKFPSASGGREASGVLSAPIDDVAVNENAIPKGVPVEIDCDAFARFPCKDGHYETSITEFGELKTCYTPTQPTPNHNPLWSPESSGYPSRALLAPISQDSKGEKARLRDSLFGLPPARPIPPPARIANLSIPLDYRPRQSVNRRGITSGYLRR